MRLSARVTSGHARQVAVGLSLIDEAWSEANYVLIPGAVYAGNRFVVRPHNYPPPMWGPTSREDRDEIHTIDLPGLRRSGESWLDQMSIDAAVPALCIYFPERRRALCLFTAQQGSHGCFNYEVIENERRDRAEILLGCPGMRHGRYFSVKWKEPSGYALPSEDRAVDLEAGESIVFDFQLHWIDCASIHELFEHVFAQRKSCFEEVPLKKEIPFSAVFETIERNQNENKWREEWDLYQTSILGENTLPVATLLFQSGWCGGMLGCYPLLQDGSPLSRERVLRNLDFFFTGMSNCGLFYAMFDGKQWTGEPINGEAVIGDDAWILTRRVGDILYFITRHLLLLRERGQVDAIKPHWEASLKRIADAVVRIWEAEGELGQFINIKTGKVEVFGTASGALIPAALVLFADYDGEPHYAEIAEQMALFFKERELDRGLTTGGPGDAMQAPDSESVAALLESYMMLYERNSEARWLEAAHAAALQAASWALSYDYTFPEGTALHAISAQTRGAWLANAQNKTGVPGICTLSGQGFLRLYRASGDARWLEFLREVSHTMPQYMGRSDKRIPCAYSGGNAMDAQPEGWICERVNVTQWGEPIGELFAYTTWCEVAMMLVCSDLPGVYAEPDTGRIVDFDHVTAEWVEADGVRYLRLTNPTKFDASVRVLIEDRAARARPLAINAAANWPRCPVAAGESVNLPLSSFSTRATV